MSLEQKPIFLILKRILKANAPGYVLYTNSELAPEQTVLDIEKRTIIVSDLTEVNIAVAAVLFQVGQVVFRLRHESTITDHADTIKMAARLHKADKFAAKWAFNSLMLYWPESNPFLARRHINKYVTPQAEWLNYLRS